MMFALAVDVNIEMMLIQLIVLLLLLLLLTEAVFATSTHNYHWSLPTTAAIQDTLFQYFLSNR
jgi:uncharacterized protein HemY